MRLLQNRIFPTRPRSATEQAPNPRANFTPDSYKWVHFSPHVLLRMGWGGSKDDLSDETKWDFTTQNFVQYYVDFNRVYALMLLLRALRGPAALLLPTDVLPTIEALEAQLEHPLRWPEDVTFEEMNIKGPGTIIRILLRAAHEKGTAEPT
jgi:hypothetical protein